MKLLQYLVYFLGESDSAFAVVGFEKKSLIKSNAC